MDQIDNVHFIKGDFQDEDVLNKVDQLLDGRKIDLVISDIGAVRKPAASRPKSREYYFLAKHRLA